MKSWIYRIFLAVVLFGIGAFLIAALWLYHERFPVISDSHREWAEFGDFFGGIASPLIAIVGLLGVLLTIEFSRSQFKKEHERNNFFGLLTLHAQKVAQIDSDAKSDESLKGVDASGSFSAFKMLIQANEPLLYSQIICHGEKVLTLRPESIRGDRLEFFAELLNRYHVVEPPISGYLITDASEKERVVENLRESSWEDVHEFLKGFGHPQTEEINRGLYAIGFSDLLEEKHIQDFVMVHVAAYYRFYDQYGQIVGHYFRNMKQILDFIAESSDSDFFRKVFRAQFSRYEILLLAHNCLSAYSNDDFCRKVIALGLLKGLYHRDSSFSQDQIFYENAIKEFIKNRQRYI